MAGSSDPDYEMVVADLRSRFPSGRICSGTVEQVLRTVAFVRLEDARGMINTLNLTSGYFRDFNERLRVGQVITAQVMYVDAAKARVHLSVRALEANPAAAFLDRIGDVVPATVVALAEHGDALLALSNSLVAHLSIPEKDRATVRVGDEVRVRISEVDLGTEPGTHWAAVALA
ncbi:S1 RNA-binding domain-containing protein [Embleya sp. NPDC020886]|uniref:S1 RNA-binding domain-containing protein n=1 Tax=Embleya sp. NPDC020886 TaxID=3363980 RepID=UPI00379B0130